MRFQRRNSNKRIKFKMLFYFYIIILVCTFSPFNFLRPSLYGDDYSFKDSLFISRQHPIDVVIPCCEKDRHILPLCIRGIKNNIQNLGRIIIVSGESYLNSVEWYDENLYPFNKKDLAEKIFLNEKGAGKYLEKKNNRIGWIYQQFLKLYAPIIIPNLSSNVLVVDADTIFLNPVSFFDEFGSALYAFGTENHEPYFSWINQLIPGLYRAFPEYSGIVHHMLFQKQTIQDLFDTIEKIHQKDAWIAMCNCINHQDLFGSCISEYELYFNFLFQKTGNFKIRQLKWANISSVKLLNKFRRDGYAFVSLHDYMRKK